jgi:hypothetical protein
MAVTECYPADTDWSCYGGPEDIAALDPHMKEIAEAMAWRTLAALTAYQLAPCPIAIRPCTLGCLPPSWLAAPVDGTGGGNFAGWLGPGPFNPVVGFDGNWVNLTCGVCGIPDCSCTQISEILLPQNTGGFVSVSIGGAVLDPSAYRVDNGNKLVRQDDGVWPRCQDMSKSVTDAEDAFVVTYYPGAAPTVVEKYAAGKLAMEYYKACNGNDCALPLGVVSITRQGVSMDIQSGMFPGGTTGIREVDAVISFYNPYALRSPSVIYSPDRHARARETTWG